VCLLGPEQLGGMTDTLRQQVAAKVNLSETAFVEPVRALQQSLQGHDCCSLSACGVSYSRMCGSNSQPASTQRKGQDSNGMHG
jgi:hypothetical protein